MTDSYVQQKLHKMLNLLKMQHPKDNVLAFKKRSSELHANMSFFKLVSQINISDAKELIKPTFQFENWDIN